MPYPDSKCHDCRGLRLVRGRGAVYLMCTRRVPKYRAQPVRSCEQFEAR